MPEVIRDDHMDFHLNRDEQKKLNMQKIVFILAERPGFAVMNIARVLDISERTVHRYISQMVDDQIILQTARGKYQNAKYFEARLLQKEVQSEYS